MTSPYSGVAQEDWIEVTRALVDQHPLDGKELADVVLSAWKAIFASTMGRHGFRIGVDILPKPQIMGFFLHELIPLELAARYPDTWRPEQSASDKDIVHVPNDRYSIEIKTSSNPQHIYGNRSYAQTTTKGKKAKSGYYLAVNFEKFAPSDSKPPAVRLVRFGWLDDSDWMGQRASTGQQSRLSSEVEDGKLLALYRQT